MPDFSPFMIARVQMALTLGYHIILACFGVGLPVLLMVVEWKYLKTGNIIWKTLAQRWAKVFAVLFGVGAISGTVLSFELGLLWPKFMGTFGAVIGLPFSLEAFAFFMEAIFVGIYLYGWDKLSPKAHWLTSIPIVISGFASAWFVVTANAWMNSPQGFVLENGIATQINPWEAMLNPSTGAQTAHMIIAAYMVSGFGIASIYAFTKLKGRWSQYHQKAMVTGLILGIVFTPLQMMVGDWSAKVVATTQPIKLAAMEGQFETKSFAPLRIGGIPDEKSQSTPYSLEIPGLLSWLSYGDFNAEVKGLKDFPSELHPPVAVVHIAFQIMVAIGFFLFLLSVISIIAWVKNKRLPQNKLYVGSVALSGILSILALQAGWIVTEVGRQPWIVYNVMKTSEAVTDSPGILYVFIATLAIYTILSVGLFFVLRALAKRPLPQGVIDHG
ncbi:MAG: cytochrome ubiquinol oxidase subunit I [Deltaproteobacteria bacterium]|nr:cytochrome ubiquinol oxidase subunit I [Deltaproteobacteria bacterium]